MFFLLALSLLFNENKCSVRLVADTLPNANQSRSLPEILIKKNIPLARLHGDTLSYAVSAYQRAGMFTLEDLLQGMPGFRVDQQGKIFFQGKAISRILLDGEDLTEERYALLSRNLRAALLSKVNVIQQYQPQRLLRDRSSSDEIALDLAVRDDAKGKWTGTLRTEHGAKGLHQQDAEGVRLSSTAKLLVFANRNNLAKPGVTVKNDPSAATQEVRYRSGPSLSYPGTTSSIPSSYAVQNKDHSGVLVFSCVLNRYSRLQLNWEAASSNLRRSVELHRQFFLGTDSLAFMHNKTRSDLQLHDRTITLRLQRDKGGNTTSVHHLRIPNSIVGSNYVDKRSVPELLTILVKGDHQAFGLEWKQTINHRLQKGPVLQIENELSTNHQFRVASYSIPGTDPRILSTVPDPGSLLHKGRLIGSQWSLHPSPGRWKWHYGIKVAAERIRSLAKNDKLHFDIYKAYSFLHASRSITRKWMQELQLAAGMVFWQDRHSNKIITPVFLVDHRYIYKPRAVERYAFGIAVNRKPMDLSMLFAGPFLDQQGRVVHGVDSISFPTVASVSFDLLRMDLYKGFTLSVNGKYALVNQQPVVATRVGKVTEGSSYIADGRDRVFFLSGQLEKLIHPLSLTYKFNASSQLQKTFQQFNGFLLPVHINHMQYEHSMVSRWSTIMNLSCFQGVTYQQVNALSSIGDLENKVTKKQIGFKLLFTPTSSLFGELSFSRIRYDHLQSLMICDAQAMWHITSRCRVSFSLQNFFDEAMMQESLVNFYGSSTQTTLLNSRRILLGLQYHF